LRFRDTQCGFKLMDVRRTRPLFERMVVDGFAFDAELLFLAVRFGLRVDEVPILWRNDARTTVRMIRDPVIMLWDLLRVRWRFRRGLYNPDAPATAVANR
jgi:dolichyl-phosphate beta-glucosyltransferase